MTAGDPPRPPRPHRPALFADLTEMIDAVGGESSPGARAEIAASTAAAVVRAGRAPGGASDGPAIFVALADAVGLDTLAALWRDSDPVSLPGALWTLYVLRQWCHGATDDVLRLWRAGEALAPADAAVAGLPDYADADAVRSYADAVLAGVYRADLAVALERAAAFFVVVAAGRRSAAARADDAMFGPGDDTPPHGVDTRSSAGRPVDERSLAARNDDAAATLTAAARLWRSGTLH